MGIDGGGESVPISLQIAGNITGRRKSRKFRLPVVLAVSRVQVEFSPDYPKTALHGRQKSWGSPMHPGITPSRLFTMSGCIVYKEGRKEGATNSTSALA